MYKMSKRSNGGTQQGQDIMMNLLGDSSDSDPELLNLPPLKNKKPTKKKKSYSSPSDTSVCSLMTLFKIILVLVVIIGVCVLGFITFWLAGQVGELQRKLDADPQSKVNVEFKPPKKMKKRRQLDALVSNGKVRRKGKSGQEHELLRTESESSEIDEFNITSQKSYMRHRGSLASTCSTCLMVFGVFLVGACILTCIGLIWMHFQMKQNLDSIRERIATVEGRNLDDLENSQSIRSQIQAINKTVHSYKIGKNGLDQIVQNITAISTKIKDLNSATESLREGLKAAPELKQIPTKLKAVSESVASLGSDVVTLKQQVQLLNNHETEVDNKLHDLSLKQNEQGFTSISPPMRESGGNINPDFNSNIWQKYDNVSKGLFQVNLTLWNRLDFLQTQLTLHKDKFAMVDNVTELFKKEIALLKSDHVSLVSTKPTTSAPSVLGDQSKTEQHSSIPDDQIVSVVNSMLKNMGITNKTGDGTKTSEILDSLLGQMDNITSIVTNLKDQLSKMKTTEVNPAVSTDTNDQSSVEELLKFKAETKQSLENFNKTVTRLSEDVTQVFTALTGNKNKLVELDHTVVHLKNYLAILGYKNESHEAVSTATVKQSTPVPETTSTENKPPTTPFSKSSTTTTSQLTETKSPIPSVNTTPSGAIHIKDINTFEDLDLNFRRWDRNGEGLVDPEDLPDYLGPNSPDPEKLKMYDANGDGKYSMKEFETALGITAPPTVPTNDEESENGV